MDATASVSIQGRGYYTNLMSEGGEELQADGMSSSPEDHLSQNGRGNQRRQNNFQKNEDELLVSAWLNISMDAVRGNNQKRTTCWNRIHEYYHSNKEFPSNRNQNSLMHRWLTIQENVNKFAGCVDQIDSRPSSGTTIQQRIVEAEALFESQEKKSFKFLHCWYILRTEPKWVSKQQEISAPKPSNKKQKATEDATPGLSTKLNVDDQEAAYEEVDIPKRPMGKKRAKAALRKGGDRAYNDALDAFWAKKHESDAEKERKKDERYKAAFALEQERVGIKRQEFEFKRNMEEDKIMSMDLSSLPTHQQQYYISRQNEIIARCPIAQGEQWM